MKKIEKPLINTQQSELLPINKIVRSPANPRNFTDHDKTIRELAENIQKVGLIHPIVVRPKNGGYEIVSGERRFRACKLLFDKIPAVVKELTDQEAHEITVTENLQREDLSPLEEANGIQTLLNSGKNRKEIADTLGKPLSWVVKRAKISDLSEKWKKGIADSKCPFSSWSVSHLEYVARFDNNIQDELYANYNQEWHRTDSLRTLRESLNSFLLKLSTFPWKLEDNSLHKKAPACSECPNRSSMMRDLFNEIDHSDIKNDQCLDKFCYGKKLLKYIQNKEKELLKKHKKVLIIAYGHGGWNKFVEVYFKERAVLHWRVNNCKKSDPKSVPGIIVNDSDAGKVKYYTVESSSSSQSKTEGSTPLKARREKLQKRRDIRYAQQIYDILEKEWKEPELVLKLSENDILSLLVAFGCESIWNKNKKLSDHGCLWTKDAEQWKAFKSTLKEFDKQKILDLLMIRIIPFWAEMVRHTINAYKPNITNTDNICGILGIDSKLIKKEITFDIPKPKAWTKLNEDGTPKKIEKKKPKGGTSNDKDKKTVSKKTDPPEEKKEKVQKKPEEKNESCKEEVSVN